MLLPITKTAKGVDYCIEYLNSTLYQLARIYNAIHFVAQMQIHIFQTFTLGHISFLAHFMQIIDLI